MKILNIIKLISDWCIKNFKIIFNSNLIRWTLLIALVIFVSLKFITMQKGIVSIDETNIEMDGVETFYFELWKSLGDENWIFLDKVDSMNTMTLMITFYGMDGRNFMTPAICVLENQKTGQYCTISSTGFSKMEKANLTGLTIQKFRIIDLYKLPFMNPHQQQAPKKKPNNKYYL